VLGKYFDAERLGRHSQTEFGNEIKVLIILKYLMEIRCNMLLMGLMNYDMKFYYFLEIQWQIYIIFPLPNYPLNVSNFSSFHFFL